MTCPMKQSQSGFTLLEMVIVVGIIGAMLGAYLSFYQPRQNAQAYADTSLKMERVLNALSSYALRINRLPCPARSNENPASASYGDVSAASCGGTSVQGIVPFKALGLTEDDVIDGFGRHFTYIVNGQLTDAPPNGMHGADFVSRPVSPPLVPVAIPGSDFCDLTTGGMTVRRTNITAGGPVTTNEAPNNVAVVVISHGIDGYGAFNMSLTNFNNRTTGNAIGSSTGAMNSLMGTYERMNAVDQNTDVTDISDYNTGVNPIANHFDDKVAYMTFRGVISRLGATGCH